MAKKSKKEKKAPNIVVFLVEGESDQIVLDVPMGNMIAQKYPDFQVRFLLQQKLVNKTGEEVEDGDSDEDDEFIEGDEYAEGGDITSSFYVTPDNIETKIHNRFIKPATKAEGVYPKRIARIIQIVDLDGAFLPDECVVPLSTDHLDQNDPFYNDEKGTIEAPNVLSIRDRNDRKRRNIDYLLSLTEKGIKIGHNTIPYEIYFFSSNLDHFIHNDANMKKNKKNKAKDFVREYGLDTNKYCKYFFDDSSSIGHLGYKGSWEEIKKGTNSVNRFTNIDCLIRRVIETDWLS